MSDRPDLDQYYVAMLHLVAARATCPRRQVGAILVDQRGRLVAMGYNGVPSGMPHCIDHPCGGQDDATGDSSRCLAIHAEVNAVLQAAGSRREPYTLYCSTSPCFTCAKILVTAGIREVVVQSLYRDISGYDLLLDAGVPLYVYAEGRRHIQ